MSEFIIKGGHGVSGSIEPQGNKNEALPILCAALMNYNEVEVANLPQIQDIQSLKKILVFLGAKIKDTGQHSVIIHAGSDIQLEYELTEELTSPIRGSITLLAPLLSRCGEVYLPKPGGDKIGRRRVDTHLLALSALGAEVDVSDSGYRLKAEKLIGTRILLDEASVTGTENAIMAAAVAEGTTIIENAASEPHVQGLCNFMKAQGVEIEGIGSNRLTIQGVAGCKNLKSAKHQIGPDYLEIGSFVSMAAVTGGELTIKNVNPEDLRMVNFIFHRLGIELVYKESESGTDLYVKPNQNLKVESDVHDEIPKIDDAPWPGYPADLVSIALVTATQCHGTVLIHEKLFESRLFFTDKLIGMGAKIVLCDPHRCVIIGPSNLHGSNMVSPDIRAGMALLIAAMAAEGESRIQNAYQIDRGYEAIDERLRSIGVKIERVN